MSGEGCSTVCEHCGGRCCLLGDHGAGFTSSIPGDEAAHWCIRCNCTWSPTFHCHDGRFINRTPALAPESPVGGSL